MFDDGAKSYNLAIAALREKCIRGGTILPRPDDETEARWAREGAVENQNLDTVRGAG